MSFMSYEEILEAIRKKEIRIAYFALPDEQGKGRKIPRKEPFEHNKDDYFVNLDPPSNDEYAIACGEYLKRSLKADSLYLHIGPYARVEFNSRGSEQREYLIKQEINNNYTFNFNIQKSSRFIVFPKESILVGTNEYIKLEGNIGASIYATVSKTDIGFSHISTIIDPWWEGVLQIGISNLSKSPQCLNYLERFCTVRFHRLATQPDEGLKHRENWPHLKNNYWFIEEDERRDLFPVRNSDPIPLHLRGKILGLWRSASIYRDDLVSIRNLILSSIQVIGIVGLVTLIFFIAKQANKLEDLNDISKNLQANKDSIVELKKDLDHLNRQEMQMGTAELSFSPIRSSKPEKIVIPFNEDLSEPPMVFVLFEGLPTSQVVYNIFYPNSSTPLKYREAILSIDYIGNFTSASSVKGKVKWLIVSPIKSK